MGLKVHERRGKGEQLIGNSLVWLASIFAGTPMRSLQCIHVWSRAQCDVIIHAYIYIYIYIYIHIYIYTYIYTHASVYIFIDIYTYHIMFTYIKAFYFKKWLHNKSAVESLQGMVSSLSWALSLPSLWPGLWTSQCALWPTLRAWRERSTHVHDPRPTWLYGEFLILVLMKTWGFIYVYKSGKTG